MACIVHGVCESGCMVTWVLRVAYPVRCEGVVASLSSRPPRQRRASQWLVGAARLTQRQPALPQRADTHTHGQNAVRTRSERGQNTVRTRSERGQNAVRMRSERDQNTVRTRS